MLIIKLLKPVTLSTAWYSTAKIPNIDTFIHFTYIDIILLRLCLRFCILIGQSYMYIIHSLPQWVKKPINGNTDIITMQPNLSHLQFIYIPITYLCYIRAYYYSQKYYRNFIRKV